MAQNYMVSLNLKEASVLIVGAGKVARRKLQGLKDTGANITIVAPDAKIEDFLEAQVFSRPFLPQDIKDKRLVYACTDDSDLNASIVSLCRANDIWVNAATGIEGDLLIPATMHRGAIHIGVDTEGLCPAYTRQLRLHLENIIDEAYEDALTIFIDARKYIRERVSHQKEREQILRALSLTDIVNNIRELGKVEAQKKVNAWLSSYLD